MRPFIRASVLLIPLLFLTPPVTAEFGPESEDGWAIGAEGHEHTPPVAGIDVHDHGHGLGHGHGHGHDHDHGLPMDQLRWLTMPDPLNRVGPFTIYPYYPLLVAEIQRLALAHPDKAILDSAGKSTAGLDLWYFEIADFARIEAGEGIPLDQREVIYIDGGTHSNEYSAVYFVTEILSFLLDEYETNETARWIVENRHIIILPMVNPDGSHAFGRMNAAWVNINRNFPGSWGAVDENVALNNPGPEPASEPETQAVIALLEKYRPDYVNSIHCCGNLWLHPYGADHLGDTPDVEMYTRTCDEVFAEVRETCGQVWSTIYPASGTTVDEGYIRIGASSWTYEMSGRGSIMPWGQPIIVEDVRWQERESWNGTIHAFLHAEKYGAHPVVTDITGDGARLTLTVENIGWGPLLNGNVTIGDATVGLPFIGPENTTTVVVEGSFAAGETSLVVDWQKRIWLAPVGERTHPLTLVERDGGLVGLLGAAEDADAAIAAERTPGFLVPMTLVALAGLLGAMRRRSVS